jgi:hypothetical protein
MPNGSEKNYKPVFAGGLGGYSFQISYNGNGNKFTWETTYEPERPVVKEDSGIIYF